MEFATFYAAEYCHREFGTCSSWTGTLSSIYIS